MNIVPFVNVILLFVLAPNDQSGEAGDSETNGETVTKTAKPRKRKTADRQDGQVSLFIFLMENILEMLQKSYKKCRNVAC